MRRTQKGREDFMKSAIQVDEQDNVATLTGDVIKGDLVSVYAPDGSTVARLAAAEGMARWQKIALQTLHRGTHVLKYGEPIGVASRPIETGAWVHIHNMESVRLPTSDHREERT
jgi:hypothetical protein